MQLDADTVGSSSPAADAEMAMMMADVLEGLGLKGKYVVKINNRKVLDGTLEAVGLGGIENASRRTTVLRAIDKLDRLGEEAVAALLGKGRKDESGDFTPGAGLSREQIRTLYGFRRILNYRWQKPFSIEVYEKYLRRWAGLGALPDLISEALGELEQMRKLIRAAEYTTEQIRIDPSVVRGLEYYTGPVFEAELTFPVTNEKGQQVVFGSVAGGGRYDGLVSRFRSEPVPATGFSIGVSRLAEALRLTGNLTTDVASGPVVVLVMDRDRMAGYQQMVAELRNANIRAELFLGNPKNFGKQLAYADQRNSPAAIIEGGDELAAGTVQIKDLIAGKRAAETIEDNEAWRAGRPGQFSVPRAELVARIKELLAKQSRG
jgi:histidyl-tRNA synthetase